MRLRRLHAALVTGEADAVGEELSRIIRDSASAFDLTSENSAHMLLLGLLFNMPGYADPVSNREYGWGRPDIRVEPVPVAGTQGLRPLLTIELKYERNGTDEQLARMAAEALAQIRDKGYDEGPLPPNADGRVRWGIACTGKLVSAVCEVA